MKRNFIRLGVFISLLSLCLFLPTLSADSSLLLSEGDPEISMDFQDADLKDILKVFSMQSGLNFIASEALQDRKITLYLDRVPLKQAMEKLFNANNLSYALDKEANIFIVKDWGKLKTETVTRVFYLKYATVSSSSLKQEKEATLETCGTSTGRTAAGTSESKETGITKAVEKLLSEDGSVMEDSRTNSLIVTDTPSRMDVIAKVIASLDVPVPQVMLEVEMLDVSKNAVDRIGFKFGQTPFTAVITGTSQSIGFPFESWGKVFRTNANRGTLAIDSGTNTYQAQLDFLRTQTDTKYLARPRILTLNNETAEIKITTKETVGITSTQTVATATSTTTTAERVETGVHLRVTPQINLQTGEVTMFIVPIIKDTATSTILIGNTGSAYYKDPEERSTKSVVRVKDGETVVMGGLIRNQKTEIVTKLPLLGDLPLIGGLFRHKDKSPDKERELLVFITPHIIKGSGVRLTQKRNTILAEREQDGVKAMVDRKARISATLSSFEGKKR